MLRVCSTTSPSGKNRCMSTETFTTRSIYVQPKILCITEGLDGHGEDSVERYRMLYILERTYKKPNRYIVTLLQSITACRLDRFPATELAS